MLLSQKISSLFSKEHPVPEKIKEEPKFLLPSTDDAYRTTMAAIEVARNGDDPHAAEVARRESPTQIAERLRREEAKKVAEGELVHTSSREWKNSCLEERRVTFYEGKFFLSCIVTKKKLRATGRRGPEWVPDGGAYIIKDVDEYVPTGELYPPFIEWTTDSAAQMTANELEAIIKFKKNS